MVRDDPHPEQHRAEAGNPYTRMIDGRAEVARAIQNAKTDLDRALVEVDRLPAFDPSAASFVAHAMANYLHVTEALTEMLRRSLSSQTDPDVAMWLEGLRHTSAMAQQTVARLLRVYEPAEMTLRFEYTRLDRLMDRACDFHRGSAAPKQVAIHCRYPPDLPEVWVDRVAVAVVADNLLSNAVKFAPAGGRVDVELIAGPGGVVCSVTDNGPGLTPLAQARLFERSHVPEEGKLPGDHLAGVGLLVAKEFVDRMAGRLWSESDGGTGARFSFRLPYQAGEEESTA